MSDILEQMGLRHPVDSLLLVRIGDRGYARGSGSGGVSLMITSTL